MSIYVHLNAVHFSRARILIHTLSIVTKSAHRWRCVRIDYLHWPGSFIKFSAPLSVTPSDVICPN